jgi:adenylate kinase
MRTEPNIVITGTPGVGKTNHCTLLAGNTGLRHVSINEVVKERGCHEGWDEGFQSWIVDEDKVRIDLGSWLYIYVCMCVWMGTC